VTAATSLADQVAAVAEALPPGHIRAWARVLRQAGGPQGDIEARLIAARPGYALGPVAADLVEAWRVDAPDLPGAARTRALQRGRRARRGGQPPQ
jgi:putative cardiolipin synthase